MKEQIKQGSVVSDISVTSEEAQQWLLRNNNNNVQPGGKYNMILSNTELHDFLSYSVLCVCLERITGRTCFVSLSSKKKTTRESVSR